MDEHDPPAQTAKSYGVGLGVLIAIGLHIVGGALVSLVFRLVAGNDFAMIATVCFGLTQLLYMVPAMVIAHKKGQPGILRGIAIITAVSFLLNAGCWGLLALNGIH